MKAAIIFACLLAVAFARPNPDAEIVKLDSDVGPESYVYNLETSDGTKKEEAGQLKDVGTDHEAIVVHGSFSWVDEKTGEKFTVNYVADENGFQPQGAHLPVAPVA
ncbi:larval cuticle protein 65Ab1-like [Anastrepha obliqua]|uniref:larval cuticle protein 65Ab1-like n=1 Tax=Anastrepha obliqua TaxID=95512 RepID=UPI0024097D1A|nr:larval cuticle protein 65Ab1-like [Anastrepha obliqua]XP_054734056.1 larval cuticle protein 65Ab1-like [Anastrepha obliqua]XP_054734151.1 larval cuticle protein 65Ab1-like [Anastrepha obliqua]